jgi:hypothetical protein
MKKNLLLLSSLLMGLVLITSCDDDAEKAPQQQAAEEQAGNSGDNSATPANPGSLQTDYFSISGATYNSGTMPSSTINETLSGVTTNSSVLAGGMNFIDINTSSAYNRFFVGVEGVPGYYTYEPGTVTPDGNGIYHYSIPVGMSTTFNRDNTRLLISGERETGEILQPTVKTITYVTSKTGDLNINLTFSNAKDVDLHLFTPSNEHIFFGNRGGTVQTTDQRTVSYGLDHDSNAGCHIDNLNNENIYIPAEKIENGEYKVVVNMFSNCDASIATTWSVIVRYKGEIITPTTGANPASGVYPVGAGISDQTVAMTFTISNTANAKSRKGAEIIPSTFKPFPLSVADEMKLEEQAYIDAK